MIQLDKDTKEGLRELGRLRGGIALKKFLEAELSLLDDVSTIKTWEETLGRQFAKVVIKDLFSFMEEDKKETRTSFSKQME